MVGILVVVVLCVVLWTAIREQRRNRRLRELQLRDWEGRMQHRDGARRGSARKDVI